MNTPTQPKKLELTPTQLATVLVIDGCVSNLVTGANQLGGWLGLKSEAEVLARIANLLEGEKQKMIADWTTLVKLAAPGQYPVVNGSVINGAKKP